MNAPTVVIVSSPACRLSATVAAVLHERHVPARILTPSMLGACRLHLQDETFSVDDEPIAGVLFRAAPDATMTHGFADEDESFCDAEVRATWLAALHLDSIVAVNSYDANAWFEASTWSLWRRRARAASIPVAPFTIGASSSSEAYWYPYSDGRPRAVPGPKARATLGAAVTSNLPASSSLLVCDEVVAGPRLPAVEGALALLRSAGIRVAEVVTDADGRLLAVDTLPRVDAVEPVSRAAGLLADAYCRHLRDQGW